MKQQLIALSLIASSGLLAQEGSRDTQTHNENGYCSTCCCAPCCCKPCCVPQPKPCIDCECYTPAFYDLQCDWGASLDIEFLYWYARETNLSYALKFNAKEIIPDGDLAFSPSDYKHVGTKWDPGFRLGLGWNSECDGWDGYLTWTWMKNKDSSSTSVSAFEDPSPTDDALINSWMNQSFGNLTHLFDHVSGSWRLTFNQIDLEIGRKYWNSRCFALRPYAAIRGAWWKTRFNTTSKRTIEPTGSSIQEQGSFTKYQDKFTNRVWGVGFLGGLQPTWYFCCNFALYANFDVALLWGRFEAKKSEDYFAQNATTEDITVDYCNSSKSSFHQMTPMLDTAIGLRWEETWCCDRYRTALDLGWEHHVLFDQNHRVKSFDVYSGSSGPTTFGFRTYGEETGNIGMGGLVLRLRWDF